MIRCWNSIQLSSNYIYGGGKKSVSINHRYQARLTSNPPLIHHHTVINLSFVRSDWNIQNPREQHFHSTWKKKSKKNDIFANKKIEKWNKTQHSTFCRFFYYFLFFFRQLCCSVILLHCFHDNIYIYIPWSRMLMDGISVTDLIAVLFCTLNRLRLSRASTSKL